MLKRATCEKCNRLLPLKPEPRDFSLAPHRIKCPGCERDIETTFPYRVTWMEGLLWKVLAIAAVPIAFLVALLGEWPPIIRILIVLVGPLLGGGFGGLVLSRMLAFPLQLVIDKVGGKRLSVRDLSGEP